ncbi:hypothetical protein I4U23_005067 [Adineta vaga]|nr:hypothetical protein I4U23_005067 [Adineta vaga]
MMNNYRLIKIFFLILFGNIFIKAKEFQCDKSLSCGCGETNVKHNEQINPYSWSMIVSIQYDLSMNSSIHICDGTILTNSVILTSANCMKNFIKNIQQNRIEIVTDQSKSVQKRIVDNIIIHPNWTSFINQYENDIVLLHLSQPLTSISQSCISNQRNISQESFIIQRNQNNNLEQRFFSKKCENFIRMGSPLFQWIENHWEQIGILSKDCKSNSFMNYIQLSYYQKWIEENMKIINKKMIEKDLSKKYNCASFQRPCGCGHKDVEFTQSIGHEAKPYSWSMIVSIRFNNKHICSGSILNESFILTSASCIGNLSTFGITIHAGIHHLSDDSRILRKVDRIFLHPNYTGILNDYVNDISILHISEPFDFNNNPLIKRSCLLEKSMSSSDSSIFPYDGDKLALIGWGQMPCDNRIQNDSLQQIEIYTGDYFEHYCYIIREHRNMQFCAGLFNQTTVFCVADPGSPIFEWYYDGWRQVGIASYALDCMQLKQFPIYTRTVEYNEWISSIVNDCTNNNNNNNNNNNKTSNIISM